ncbi:PTS system galactitol-specific IIA component [Pectinatus haikarae]|uniref:PTS system galactitol-specific IIA component n=1 Tax=Pectinatus haikarae TaxID=349096 RepID=A0ABT9Y6X5_9FIRM|nr:PTS system galactitol-specific IIA component [Pectinatus haikarae]
MDLIKINLDSVTDKEVIKELGSLMKKKNYVKQSYIDAVLHREESLPTGLNIGDTCVAIPHTDPIHVNMPAIAVGCLKNPVKFRSMIDPERKLDVRVVFLLAVKDPKKQVELLTKLMDLFKNVEILKEIETADKTESIAQIMDKAIS